MGGTRRAQIYSNKFKNRTLKAIALYAFDKCGNCTNRIKCGEELLASGKKQAKPIKFVVDTILVGCPKTKFSGVGTLPREVAAFINEECAKCNKSHICIGYLAQHSGHITPKERELVQERLGKCISCPDLANCIHYFTTQLGISKFSLVRHAFLVKFRKCSSEKMMKISLDLPPGTEGNVLGSVKKEQKAKADTSGSEIKQ